MLPGVAPTHKKVSIPLVLVVLFEGDKVRSRLASTLASSCDDQHHSQEHHCCLTGENLSGQCQHKRVGSSGS